MEKKFLNKYSNCIIVKGANRSTICDLQNERYYLIPNSFEAFLDYLNTNKCQFNDALKEFKRDKVGILLFVNYFVEQDVLFFTNYYNKSFISYPLDWDYPSQITNFIIDYSSKSNYSITVAIKKIVKLRCKNICIRFFKPINEKLINSILIQIHDSTEIETLELVLPFGVKAQINFDIFYKITNVYYYESDGNRQSEALKNVNLHYFQKKLTEKDCGVVEKSCFGCSIPKFTESINFNSCLNRKMAVDSQGLIKNCPSMLKNFGGIETTSLEATLKKTEFNSIWKIGKDKIKVCQDCEFRHICTDCRAYIENPKDIFSKPLKCGYNPYNNKWEEWSDSPFKKKVIEYYGIKP